METVKIIQLTEYSPSTGMSAGRTVGGSTDGTRLVVMQNNEGFWYCFDGSHEGNWFESDDQGPYLTESDAIEAGQEDWQCQA